MLTILKSWFQSPIFPDDEDKTRVAGMLHLILLVFLSATIVAFLLAVTGSLPITNRAFINSSMIITPVAVITLLVILHKGYVRFVAWGFLFFQWASTVIQVIWSGGIESPVISAFIITILLAGFLINKRAVFLFAGLSILTILGVWQLESCGHLPPRIVFVSPQGKVFIILTIMAASAALLILATRALNNALIDSRAYTKELEQAVRERTQVEAALQQSEDIYRRAIMAAGAVPYVFDHATRTITFIGEGILPMTGYSASEMMSSGVWNSVVQEGFPRGNLAHLTYEEADRITDEDNSIPWECDFRIRTRDGQTRWIADTSVKGFDEKSGHFLAIGIKQDITERKLAEEMREKLIKELEQRNAELERFAYTLSHELRSPLITIRGFLGYLREDALSGNSTRLESDIRRISDGADKMQRLITELLELLSIGRIVNPFEEISFRTLADEAIDLVHERTVEQGITVHIADNLPLVYGDHKRLVEVLQNLIENSAKYMGNQPEPRIEIGQQVGGDNMPVFFVRDNGIGIEPRFKERIFDIFAKLDAQSEGTGIGLALVKRIIELHGGKIWIESEGIGKGSMFCFTIPNRTKAEN